MLKVLLAVLASDSRSVCFQIVPGIWTKDKNDLHSTNRNKSCGNHGDVHQSCCLISPSLLKVWSGRKNESKSGWQKKMQFTSDKNPIIKGESTTGELWVDHISHFLGLYPAYLPEMQHFCLRMADYYSSPPIAAYWYYIQKCHVIFPKHSDCEICLLKFFRTEMPEVFPDIAIIILGPPVVHMISTFPIYVRYWISN